MPGEKSWKHKREQRLHPHETMPNFLFFWVKRKVSGEILCLVLISVERHIKINRDKMFLITCLVLQIFNVLRYANSLWCHLLTHTGWIQVVFYKARNIIRTNQQNLSKLYTNIVMLCRRIFVEELDAFCPPPFFLRDILCFVHVNLISNAKCTLYLSIILDLIERI